MSVGSGSTTMSDYFKMLAMSNHLAGASARPERPSYHAANMIYMTSKAVTRERRFKVANLQIR